MPHTPESYYDVGHYGRKRGADYGRGLEGTTNGRHKRTSQLAYPTSTFDCILDNMAKCFTITVRTQPKPTDETGKVDG
jgi:hypothetical protein